MTGEREELDRLFGETYDELRRLAARVREGESSQTLNPTALVNEAYVKLAASPSVGSTSLSHFKRLAARAMRQVLVEAARRRRAQKRGGDAVVVTFDESLAPAAASAESAATADELLELDAALEAFARINERQAAVVELRFFAGLSLSETAVALQVSEATVDRDWRAARAWLARQLHRRG